ncbi:hypothetical protein BY458DRAFT_507054 [Sporodiniella umbellata]|nr:hypothetical protein BY458DRAFT_507054 [Sporodiniella umbellata]
MGVSLLTYVITFFFFICNYALTLSALIFPKWITFSPPTPFYMETNYGLFQLCRSLFRECRPFPSYNHGDCDEDGFCELWRMGAAGMVVAAVVGAMTLAGLLITMCSQRRKRDGAWQAISLMFLLYAIPQALSMSAIAYLYNTSPTFYMGARYNFSFILCIISWIVGVVLALVLCLIGSLSPPGYSYQAI